MAEEKKKRTDPPMLSHLQPSIPCNFWTKFSSRMLMWYKTGHVIFSNLYLIDCKVISYPLKCLSQSLSSCSIFHSKNKKSHFLQIPSLLFKSELLHLCNWWHWTTYLILTSNIPDSDHITQSSPEWLRGICPIPYPIYDIHTTEKFTMKGCLL